MKFMKLGSKPDAFQTDCNHNTFLVTELASDIIVNVGDARFFLHKFPLLSKSSHLQKLVAAANEGNIDEIHIPDIPGGPSSFEICAKFCYGMTATLNAYNIVAARCAAEYLEMHETVEKGNLVQKLDVFLNTGIFRGWRDSIIALHSTNPLQPWPENLKLVGRCVDSIASKACADISKVYWSYTYSRRRKQSVPTDWWAEDLCDLHLDLYSRVLLAVKAKERVLGAAIGKALKMYAYKNLPGFGKAKLDEGGQDTKNELIIDAIVGLLPPERSSVSCDFMIKLLASCSETVKLNLVKKIGRQLDQAQLDDILFLDVDMVLRMAREFILIERKIGVQNLAIKDESKVAVGKLIDGYLAEIAKDCDQPLEKFIELADMVSGDGRPIHDDLYHAIDLYLKEHQNLTKSQRKRLCSLMDCKKLSPETTLHAVQNERLPLRVVVQVFFSEQLRAAAPPGLPNCSGCGTEMRSGSNTSLRSVITEENIESEPAGEDISGLKSAVAANSEVKGAGKVKKIFGRLLTSRGRGSDSDTTGSPDPAKGEEMKSTTLRNGRHSVS